MLKISKIHTDEGYRVEVACDRHYCYWTGELDPQAPLWAAFLKMEEHYTLRHRGSGWAERRAMSQHPGKGMETLELPHDDDD